MSPSLPSPRNASELLRAAALALRRGDLRMASRAATRAIAIEPSAAAYEVRGIARTKSGEAGAEGDFAAALELDPASLRAHRWLIDTTRGTPRLREVSEGLLRAVATTRSEPLALLAAELCDQLCWPSGAVMALSLVALPGATTERSTASRSTACLALAHRLAWAADDEGVDALLAGASDSFEVAHLLCRARVRSGEPAGEALERLVGLARSPLELRQALEVHLEAGALDAALALARSRPELGMEAARLLLWSGDTSLAEQRAPSDPRFAAALSALRSDWRALLRSANAMLEASADSSEGWLWRGEALRHLGESDAALDAIEKGSSLAPAGSFATELNRTLAKQHLEGVWWLPWIEAALGVDRGRLDRVMAAAQALLDRMHGNRSPTLTTWDGSTWRRFEGPLDVRHAARMLQLRVSTRPDTALEGLAALAARVPLDPMPHTHAGELLLWLGRYTDAEAAFRRALELDPATRWAWIGLGASRMYQGDVTDALATWERSARRVMPGRTMWIYRAEAHVRTGDLAAARASLARSRELSPGRLANEVLGGLVDGAPERALGAVARRCPAIARSVAPGLSPERALWALLDAMRGNRALDLVTWLDGDRLCVWHAREA